MYCVDIDVESSRDKRSGVEKRAGTKLWDKLVAKHGEPATLKAVTGSGGFHFYFSRSGIVGLNRSNNFAGLVVDGVALKGVRVAELDESSEKSVTYGIDGRGVGGLCFAPPSRYMGKQGEKKTYSWAPGGDGVPQPMPTWLVDVINACSFGARLPIAPELSGGLPTPQPFASADGGVRSSPLGSGDAPTKQVEVASIPAHLGLLVHELKAMLREKANDSMSAYGGTTPHGLYGTYYGFRTQGPKRCFFGRDHSGSNNFNLLKRGRNVFYRCHGDQCLHEPVRKLGKLTLEAALQDASIDPVSSEDQIDIFKKYLEQGRSAFLNFVAEVARGGDGQPFEGLAKIFSFIYQSEGRILNTGEKKIFVFWDGRGWIEDMCNKVLGVFAAQMGALLIWYAQERLGLFQRIFVDKLSGLDLALKTLDKEAVQRYLNDPKWKQIKDESARRVKVELPAIAFNVQDPTIIKRCLQFVVTDLYVTDLSSHMNKDPLLVNFQNGVGYIPTGKLMKPHPSHLCSLQAGGEYHPKPIGTRSRFKEFLLDVANGNKEVVCWKILWLGYCLSGYTDEETVVFWWEEGGNGKGVLKQAILAAWGDYGIICSKHIFMKPKDDTASAATSHLAQLKGIRISIADELDDGKIINASTIKEQTGGGAICARELFERPKNFVPTHKLALLTNNKPRIPLEEVNDGLRRRIVLEVYPNQYVEDSEFNPGIATHRRADVGLEMYLESKEGIEDVTRVVFEGAHEWFKLRTANNRIQKVLWPQPKVFTEACNEYLKENDTLSTFLEQECLLGPNKVVMMSELSTAYKVKECEDQRMTSQAFTKALKAHRITTDRKHPKVPKLDGYGSGRPYIGVRLLTQLELEERHATAEGEVRKWQEERG
jgi:P4 family phage/plasmid primase-like protien